MAKKIVRGSLRKHPFLLALRPLGTSPRETSPAAKSEEKRMFPQAMSGETLGWVVSAFCCRIISSVAGQYEDPIKANYRVAYPFRIVKINHNIFNKHKSARVHVGVLWIDCDYRRIFDK